MCENTSCSRTYICRAPLGDIWDFTERQRGFTRRQEVVPPQFMCEDTHRMSNSRLWRLKHTVQTVLSSSEVAELRSTSLFFIHLFFLLTSLETHFYLQPFWGRVCWVSNGTALSFVVGMKLRVKIVTVSQMFWWHRDMKKNTCSAHFLRHPWFYWKDWITPWKRKHHTLQC